VYCQTTPDHVDYIIKIEYIMIHVMVPVIEKITVIELFKGLKQMRIQLNLTTGQTEK